MAWEYTQLRFVPRQELDRRNRRALAGRQATDLRNHPQQVSLVELMNSLDPRVGS